jgi:hypothetical protein
MSTSGLWAGLLIGYLFSITVETPILLIGLSARHSRRRRLFAGVWLTACTYPVVVLVLPFFFRSKSIYVVVAESFAPVTECVLFWLAFGKDESGGTPWPCRDFAVILLANLASFGLGEVFLPAISA